VLLTVSSGVECSCGNVPKWCCTVDQIVAEFRAGPRDVRRVQSVFFSLLQTTSKVSNSRFQLVSSDENYSYNSAHFDASTRL